MVVLCTCVGIFINAGKSTWRVMVICFSLFGFTLLVVSRKQSSPESWHYRQTFISYLWKTQEVFFGDEYWHVVGEMLVLYFCTVNFEMWN